MRLLLLNYEYPPLGGGAGNATYYLLQEYKHHKDLHVDVITSSTGVFRKEYISNTITIHFLNIGKQEKNFHYQSNTNLIVYAWKCYWYAKRLIKNKSYDGMHAFFGIPCGILAFFLGLPYIISLRGSDVPFYSKRYEIIDKIAFRHISALVWHKARFVVANSKGLKELAHQSIPQQDICIIPNGVDTAFFYPDVKKRDVFRILFVGRLIPRKRVDLIIDAYAALPSALRKKTEFLVVGEGPERQNLEERAKNLDVTLMFLGKKSKKELQEIYQSASIYVLVSEKEGMSNTLLEAMASGLPVIVSDTGGTEELVTDGKNGFIVSHDSHIIASHFKTLIENRNEIKRMSKESRIIAETYSWQIVADLYFHYFTLLKSSV